MQPAFLDDISVVLVRPLNSGNIGAVARSMMNMGVMRLKLVDPVASHLNREAIERAMYARPLIEKAEVFMTLPDAVRECNHVIGTSGKQRNTPLSIGTPRQVAEKTAGRVGQKTAFVFGPEDSGLNNEELQSCTEFITIPSSDQFPSLNLSHAVLVVLYELFTLDVEDVVPEERALATNDEREGFYIHLEEALKAINYIHTKQFDPIMKDIRSLFNRAELDTREVRILRGICRQMINRAKPNDA